MWTAGFTVRRHGLDTNTGSPLAPGGQVVRLGGARYWFYIGNVDTTCPCLGLAGAIPVAPDTTFTNTCEQ